MTHGIKPFRQVVAEYYLERNRTFDYLDVARDLQVAKDVADAAFKGIWHSGRYKVEKYEKGKTRKMRILSISDKRGRTDYTNQSKKKRVAPVKSEKESANLERLKRSFCGLR